MSLNPRILRERDWEFEGQVMKALGVLREIASGQTERGCCPKGAWERGTRPMKLKEAIAKASNAAFQLNAAINKFNETQPKPWDWAEFDSKEP